MEAVPWHTLEALDDQGQAAHGPHLAPDPTPTSHVVNPTRAERDIVVECVAVDFQDSFRILKLKRPTLTEEMTSWTTNSLAGLGTV